MVSMGTVIIMDRKTDYYESDTDLDLRFDIAG
jgi:hypothetical protein